MHQLAERDAPFTLDSAARLRPQAA
jgi:hypothetical protein